MRLFIAINFSDETLSALLELRNNLRGKSIRGNFSAPENLHLTLAFLDECDEKQFIAAKTAMEEVMFQPIKVEINRIGLFKRGSGGIWWAGVRENKPLMALQRDLTNKLITAGFKLDTRKYSPHITLGREVVTDEHERALTPFGETINAIDLMVSERIGGKLTYTALYTKLGHAQNPWA